ncbi:MULTISPECIES: YezD family protein [Brevibacillus]
MQKISDALKGIEYGSVHITIHDSNITQIERVERHRYSLEKKEFSKKQKG